MSKTVTVIAHPTTGNVITPSANNPEYGTFRVDSVETTFVDGFVNESKRTAFVRGKITTLNNLNLTANKKLGGKIVKQESFEPFFEGQEPKINPSDEQVVLTDGKETFLQYNFVQDPNALDTWVGDRVVALSEEAQSALAEQSTFADDAQQAAPEA